MFVSVDAVDRPGRLWSALNRVTRGYRGGCSEGAHLDQTSCARNGGNTEGYRALPAQVCWLTASLCVYVGGRAEGGVGTWQRSPELFAVVKPRLGRGIRPSQAFATPKTAPDLAMKPSFTLMKTL